MFEAELEQVGEQVRANLHRLGSIPPERIHWIPIPFSGHWGFGTAACFQSAAAEPGLGKAEVAGRAAALAQQAAAGVRLPHGIARLVAEKAYLNVYFDAAVYARRVVDQTIGEAEAFGRGAPKGERVMVEYFQPNTHHSIHIGHARAALLGESLARLVEFAGFDTVRASYPGDMGLGVITCMWAYQRFHAGQEPEGIHERGRWLANIYAEATQLLSPGEDETEAERAQREGYDAERREMYRRWDAGDPEVRQLWLKTRQWSLDELNDVLRMLDIRMDVLFFESEAAAQGKQIVEELIQRGIAEDERPSGGPVIVRIDDKLGLKKEKYRTAVILRSDGTTLYLTNDLALAKRKFEEYHVDRSVYVVDVRQSLHFQQVFKILELWGFAEAAKCYHLAFGFVSLPAGAMSSRKGNVVFFKDVADEAVRRVLAVIEEKNPDLPEAVRHEVAAQVGLGALAYAMLSVDNTRDIVFDMENALSFDGQSAPYIQNAHVRACSILRKAGAVPPPVDFTHSLEPLETELIDLLARFPTAVQQAALDYKPLHMANYAYEVARAFHAFYHAVPVLQAGAPATVAARLRLTAAARQILANSLRLLDIQAPESM
jgi:arginyl-tRNA synthetase